MSIGHLIPEIRLFKNLTLKIQGQGMGKVNIENHNMGPRGGTGPNSDGGVPLLNAKTHPCLRETKGPDKPHV